MAFRTTRVIKSLCNNSCGGYSSASWDVPLYLGLATFANITALSMIKNDIYRDIYRDNESLKRDIKYAKEMIQSDIKYAKESLKYDIQNIERKVDRIQK